MSDTAAERSVLIAGAGPVGMTAALELARRGFAPRIVDKADGPAPLSQSRALAVNARSLALLGPSGAAAQIVARGPARREMRVRSRERLLVRIDLSGMGGKYTGIHALPQGRTERILMERMKACGVEIEWKKEAFLTGSDPQAPEVGLVSADGSEEIVRPDMLIAAEGAHSGIRKALGAGFPGESVEAGFYLADFRYEQPIDTHFGEAVFFNPGVLARLPVASDTLRYISTMENFIDLIDHPAPVAGIPWKTGFHVSFRHVDPMSKGNVFLAGDAAHIHSPSAGAA